MVNLFLQISLIFLGRRTCLALCLFAVAAENERLEHIPGDDSKQNLLITVKHIQETRRRLKVKS